MPHSYSPTSLQALSACGKRYQLDNETPPDDRVFSAAAIRGSLLHTAIEKRIVDAAKLRFLYEDTISRHEAQGHIQFAHILNFEWLQNMVSDIWAYFAEISLEIVHQELPLSMEFEDDTISTGGLDIVCRLPETKPDKVSIIDLKTGLFNTDTPSLSRNLQLASYYLLAKANGLEVDLCYLMRTKDLTRFKTGKRAGERAGPVLYPIRIADVDTPVIKQWLRDGIALAKSGIRTLNPGSMCVMCSHNTVCPKFQTGLIAKPDANDKAMSIQRNLEASLFKESRK